MEGATNNVLANPYQSDGVNFGMKPEEIIAVGSYEYYPSTEQELANLYALATVSGITMTTTQQSPISPTFGNRPFFSSRVGCNSQSASIGQSLLPSLSLRQYFIRSPDFTDSNSGDSLLDQAAGSYGYYSRTEQELANLYALLNVSGRTLPPHQHSTCNIGSPFPSRQMTLTWTGELPPRIHNNPTYSCKVFLGGLPWKVTEPMLIQAFIDFGPVTIEWPGKDQQVKQPKGFAYMIFENENKVKQLLDNCTHKLSRGDNWYCTISYIGSARKIRSRLVQVIPWALSDINYELSSKKVDRSKTVFVGALHGMINAEALAKIMNDLFGGVAYAALDIERHQYPIGSARITFSSHNSFMKAVLTAFVDIKTLEFTKRIQIDPYLIEDSPCSLCSVLAGPFFCRDVDCLRYYCKACWWLHHSSDSRRLHKPLSRNSRNNSLC